MSLIRRKTLWRQKTVSVIFHNAANAERALREAAKQVKARVGLDNPIRRQSLELREPPTRNPFFHREFSPRSEEHWKGSTLAYLPLPDAYRFNRAPARALRTVHSFDKEVTRVLQGLAASGSKPKTVRVKASKGRKSYVRSKGCKKGKCK